MSRKAIPGASVRARYMKRAEVLRDEPEFRERLREMRSDWDQRYLQFAIGRPGVPPEADETFRLWDHVVLPPRLQHALDHNERNGQQDMPLRMIAMQWTQTVVVECSRWWPERYYPNYISSSTIHNPAQLFLSLCLVYQERLVLETAVFTNPFEPQFLLFDPRKPDRDFFRVTERAFTHALTEAVQEVFADRPDDLDRVFRRAQDAEFEAMRQMDEAGARSIEAHWWYVPLLPGMTPGDWDDMKPKVMEKLRELYGEHPVADYARQLAAEKMRPPQIAKLLGLSEDAVRNYLKQR